MSEQTDGVILGVCSQTNVWSLNLFTQFKGVVLDWLLANLLLFLTHGLAWRSLEPVQAQIGFDNRNLIITQHLSVQETLYYTYGFHTNLDRGPVNSNKQT